MSDNKFHLDDSLVRLLLKKKRQTVKRFYRSGTLDTENITAAFTSKNIFTRISGDNRRGTCHVLLDCSGSTYNDIGDDLRRIHVMGACALQMARYLSRFYKVKMSLFRSFPLKVFDVPKSYLPEQFGVIVGNSMADTGRMSAFLNREKSDEIKAFTECCGNNAPLAIRTSIEELEKSNTRSLIVAVCDGDPYCTNRQENIDKMVEFQKKHAVIFSVIDSEEGVEELKKDAAQLEKKYGIKTAMTTDDEAVKTGGGMVINNTLLKIHETLR